MKIEKKPRKRRFGQIRAMGEETEPTVVAEGVTADEPSKDQRRKRKKLLHKSLLELMEFYLGDVNLAHDKFLIDRIKRKPFVYVDLSIFLTFNRIKALTSDIKDLAKSVKHSEFLQLSEDESQVCRITPIKRKKNEDECTIYVEQLGPDINHDILTKVFSEFGPVDYISLPRYSHNGKFKGFAFVEFRDSDCAQKALELLSAKGCCLSPHMAPEELISIKSFDTSDKGRPNKEGHGTKEQPCKKKSKRKHSDGDEIKQPTDGAEEEPTKKKMKTSLQSSETAEVTQSKDGGEVINPKNKRKLSSGENLPDKPHMEKKSDEDLEPAKKKAKSDTEGASETDEASHTEVEATANSAKQKKRKRKKKMKKDKVTASSLGVRVLSKKEWKQLRNRYLNMQREVMTTLKQQLYRPRPETGRPKVEEQFKPGTVIKVTMEEPVVNTNTTKSEFRIHPDICYVDAKEGNSCVYLRTTSPDLAASIVQTKHWPNMEILKGEEESAYWDKIKIDRLEYFQQKPKRNKRGRTKLLKRAEKFQEKQI